MSLLVGIGVGLVLGLTGAGGSVFAVPMFVGLLGLAVPDAIGLSLGAVAVSSLFGVLNKLSTQLIQWLPGLVFAVIGAMVAPLGNSISRKLPADVLFMLFAVLIVGVGIRLFIKTRQNERSAVVVRASNRTNGEFNTALCRRNSGKPFELGYRCISAMLLGGISTGLLSGLLGVGGGFIVVPTLMALLIMDIRQAVATSLLVIAIVSSSGFAMYVYQVERVDMSLLALVSVGGVVGMLLGIKLSNVISTRYLQFIFSLFMVATGAWIVFFEVIAS